MFHAFPKDIFSLTEQPYEAEENFRRIPTLARKTYVLGQISVQIFQGGQNVKFPTEVATLRDSLRSSSSSHPDIPQLNRRISDLHFHLCSRNHRLLYTVIILPICLTSRFQLWKNEAHWYYRKNHPHPQKRQTSRHDWFLIVDMTISIRRSPLKK